MNPAVYRELRRIAARATRVGHEAEDIIQDALVAAVESGRDLLDPGVRPWLAGVVRRRASFQARGAIRRKRRDGAWFADSPATAQPVSPIGGIVGDLPPSLAVLLALALTGHSRHEIAWLLGINDVALRQRVAALKRTLKERDAAMPAEPVGLTLDLRYGAIRVALKPLLVHGRGTFAAHDPDGHLFVVRRPSDGSRNAGPRQQGDGGSLNRKEQP